MSGPRISVILPVYNGERFLRKALQCIFDQEYPAHEIIVINDGSKDGTQQVLDGLRGRIISKTIPNGGVSNARNEGIRIATGEYIAFLDADDIWFRNKLKVIAGLIEKYPEADLLASDYVLRLAYYGNRLRRHSSFYHYPEKINYNAPLKLHPLRLFLVCKYTGTPSAVVVKKTTTEKIGYFNAKVRICEDLDFYLRMATQGNFVLSSDILLYKYNHENNLSNDDLRNFLARRSVYKEFLAANKKFIMEGGFADDLRRSMARTNYMVGDCYFEQGEKRNAFAMYVEALSCQISPRSLLVFLWKITRKMTRILTFDRVNRKVLQKLKQ